MTSLARDVDSSASELPPAHRSGAGSDVGVLIPSRRGGELLRRVIRRILDQRLPDGARARIVLVDSGSEPDEIEALRSLGARVESIPASAFDHGAVRDRAASLVDSPVLVFLNQDALPIDERWLERLVAPFASSDPPAAVQGGIREFPPEGLRELGRRRYYWDSCGARFYFTRESEGWIARHGGVGFSTVNCAIARWAWEELPFGPAPILEDKLWQKRATARGWKIADAPEAAVWHTHDYDFPALVRRCASEGFGWRFVGERYPLRAALRDLRHAPTWRDWKRGWASGEMRTASERLFPVVRPLSLWWGNRFARRVAH